MPATGFQWEVQLGSGRSDSQLNEDAQRRKSPGGHTPGLWHEQACLTIHVFDLKIPVSSHHGVIKITVRIVQRLSVLPHLICELRSAEGMANYRRLLQAASALSTILTERRIPHAFHGTITTTVLGSGIDAQEIFCIVEGSGNIHPFRRVRDALADSEDFRVTNASASNRLFVTYQVPTPVINIEILPSGEEGPLHIDNRTAMYIRGVPFLNITEYSRAKLRAWLTRGGVQDAIDLTFILNRYWHRININRIPEADMERFVTQHTEAAESWEQLKAQYVSDVE